MLRKYVALDKQHHPRFPRYEVFARVDLVSMPIVPHANHAGE